MAGIGAEASGGLQGLMAAIRQMEVDRMAKRQYADKLSQQDFENQRALARETQAGKQLDATTENTRAVREFQNKQFEGQQKYQNAQIANLEADNARSVREQYRPGDFVQEDNPALQSWEKYGIKTGDPVQAGEGMGPMFQGPMDTGETPQIAQVTHLRGRLMTPTSAQAQQDALRQDREADNLRQSSRDEETTRHNREMERLGANKPAAVQLITTVGPDGKPVQQFVRKEAGATFDKPVPSIVENRLASAQTVKQTGDDIIASMSNPSLLQALGPAMGRYTSLQDFIGNPPPEFAELAGQIESYALANMGVHGMRSTQGAQQINEMLSKAQTPESLAAKIRGLNAFSEHFMENEGRGTRKPSATSKGGNVSMVAPDGRVLSVPADKVAEMESHGAKRQ